MKYFGSTENFKNRYAVHKSSLNNRPACHTTLSSYVWKLKDQNIPYCIDWSIRARGHAFSSGSKSCDLCLTEKLIILTENQETMLNKQDELLESCRHRRKHLLVSVKKQKIDTGDHQLPRDESFRERKIPFFKHFKILQFKFSHIFSAASL